MKMVFEKKNYFVARRLRRSIYYNVLALVDCIEINIDIVTIYTLHVVSDIINLTTTVNIRKR